MSRRKSSKQRWETRTSSPLHTRTWSLLERFVIPSSHCWPMIPQPHHLSPESRQWCWSQPYISMKRPTESLQLVRLQLVSVQTFRRGHREASREVEDLKTPSATFMMLAKSSTCDEVKDKKPNSISTTAMMSPTVSVMSSGTWSTFVSNALYPTGIRNHLASMASGPSPSALP